MRLHWYPACMPFLLTFYCASFNINQLETLIKLQILSNTRANLSYLFMRPLIFELLQCWTIRCVSLY